MNAQSLPINKIVLGDTCEVMRTFPENAIDCCVTSPPYFGLRDYGHDKQIGLESTPEEYVARMVEVFREVRRVLRDDGTLWLNLGDSYSTHPPTSHKKEHQQRIGVTGNEARLVAMSRSLKEKRGGLPEKNLLGIPWRVAFALQADGWWLRQDIIWHKPNPMPESVRDRCTKAHEYIFLMTKSDRYFYDAEAVSEPSTQHQSDWKDGTPKRSGAKRGEFEGKTKDYLGRESFRVISSTRNRRSVWTITTKPYKGAHFAVMPPDLVEPCVLAGSREGGIVLDPFSGSGTTAMVAQKLARNFIGIELNPEYVELSKKRLEQGVLF